VVVEKPFGRDAASARELNATIERVFAEPQIYRIDHYLGKETVQNILALRFANGIFEPLWNRNYIHHVQILVAESEGVGTRAGYYESAGVVRDMFQNHLLQLLTLTAMEAPVEFAADPVRDEKVKVLRALRSLAEDGRTTFRAQYGPGEVDGERVPGYLEEEGVAPDSRTETLLAACLWVDNWRWAGVPFYLRSGKRLPERRTEIAIQFKQAPLSLFGGHSFVDEAPNRLVLHLQPDEGITLSFGAKAPGGQMEIVPVEMAFDYAATFHAEPPEAYERLLLDALQGDPTLFTRWDETLVAWEFTDEIIRTWAADDAPLPTYPAGSWGPPGMDDFIRSGGCAWRAIPPLRAA
jgi:glucose-6-phosphate 1-dehydrogenase